MTPTHYEVLGVTPDVTADELRTAYRKKVRTAHPDAGGSDEAFHAVQTAYDVLSDPDERAAYDRALANPSDIEFDDFADIPEWGETEEWTEAEHTAAKIRTYEGTGPHYAPTPHGVRIPWRHTLQIRRHPRRSLTVLAVAVAVWLVAFVMANLSTHSSQGLRNLTLFLLVAMVLPIGKAMGWVRRIVVLITLPLLSLRWDYQLPYEDGTYPYRIALLALLGAMVAGEAWGWGRKRLLPLVLPPRPDLVDQWQQMLDARDVLGNLWWINAAAAPDPYRPSYGSTHVTLYDPRTQTYTNMSLRGDWPPGWWVVLRDNEVMEHCSEWARQAYYHPKTVKERQAAQAQPTSV